MYIVYAIQNGCHFTLIAVDNKYIGIIEQVYLVLNSSIFFLAF